jgi:hypothetical protein
LRRQHFVKAPADSLLRAFLGEIHAGRNDPMGRIFIIAVAVVMGALGFWYLVPAISLATVGSDAPALTDAPGEAEESVKMALLNGPMSQEERRARAEQLVGEPLKYLTDDEVRSPAWFTEHGVAELERAMDECFLMTDPDLHLRHILETSGRPLEDMTDADKLAMLKSMQPTLSQLHNCVNAQRAYAAFFDAKAGL